MSDYAKCPELIHAYPLYRVDPEVGAYVGNNSGADNQAIGVDNGRYPLTPVYTFNITVNF